MIPRRDRIVLKDGKHVKERLLAQETTAGPSRFLFVLVLFFLFIGGTSTARAARWLPERSLFPRLPGDLRDPRIGLTSAFDEDRFAAALGGPLPIVAGTLANTRLDVVLEAGGFFTLGKDGSFFPLRTFDGLLGLGLEGARGDWRARLRLSHLSAHKADGDSTVAFRAGTFSREFATLDVGRTWDALFAYLRVGASWHAVPSDEGPHLAGGFSWQSGLWFAAAHLDSDRQRGWHLNKTALTGIAPGTSRTFRVGFRIYSGDSPQGRYFDTPIQYLGLEIQYGARARFRFRERP